MEFNFNTDIILIVSRNQSGKTTLIKNIIENVPADSLLILDTQNSFKDKKYINVYYPIYHTSEILTKFIIRCRTQSDKLIVLDDLDVFHPQFSNAFFDLCVSNAHQNLGIIISAKRVIGLQKVLLQNIKYLVFSANIPLEDKLYLNKAIGKIDWDAIDKLPKYSFMVYNTYENKYSIIKTKLIK